MTINTLIDAFLKSLCIDREELSNQIIQTELKILNILDYNPLILDDNVHQLSFILYDIMRMKVMENKNGERNGEENRRSFDRDE